MDDWPITVGLHANKVTKSPDEGNVLAEKGSSFWITWHAPESEKQIVEITSVIISGWKYKPPEKVDARTWKVFNPNSAKKKYDYVLKVKTKSGMTPADPEIDNQGQNGGAPEDKPPGGKGAKGAKGAK